MGVSVVVVGRVRLAFAAVLAGVSAMTAGAVAALAEDWPLQAGGVVVVVPKYEGSEHYKVLGFPFIAPAGLGDDGGGLSVKGPDHIQYRLYETQGFEFGPLAGYRFGRQQDDGKLLHGLGDVDGGIVVGAYAAYKFGPFKALASYHHQVTGDDTGGVLKMGVEAETRLSPGFKLTAGVGTTYADGSYMQSFFGVTAAQMVHSTAGLSVYSPDAGIKDVNLSLVADIALAPRWDLKLIGNYARLVGDAADSPVIETENQFFGGAVLSYKFNWTR